MTNRMYSPCLSSPTYTRLMSCTAQRQQSSCHCSSSLFFARLPPNIAAMHTASSPPPRPLAPLLPVTLSSQHRYGIYPPFPPNSLKNTAMHETKRPPPPSSLCFYDTTYNSNLRSSSMADMYDASSAFALPSSSEKLDACVAAIAWVASKVAINCSCS